MNALILQLWVLTIVGWLNRSQQQVVDYLLEENRVRREQLRGRRLRLSDAQCRRLAVRARALGRRALTSIACIVTPDTHPQLMPPSDSHGEARRERNAGRSLESSGHRASSMTAGYVARVPDGVGID